jgi:hypothetical protein
MAGGAGAAVGTQRLKERVTAWPDKSVSTECGPDTGGVRIELFGQDGTNLRKVGKDFREGRTHHVRVDGGQPRRPVVRPWLGVKRKLFGTGTDDQKRSEYQGAADDGST